VTPPREESYYLSKKDEQVGVFLRDNVTPPREESYYLSKKDEQVGAGVF
jgi:hypothetical protein